MSPQAVAALRYIEGRRDSLVQLSDAIWELAELALHEHESASRLAGALEAEGFTVQVGVGGLPTAFVATWGSGQPVIGFLGEYDALGGLSQQAVPYRMERVPGAPGHGCGHNLLGTGAYGAAIGLKHQLEESRLPGTIKYFGCPAEENLSGKAFMAREGLFDACDACLTWHPSSVNKVATGSSLANNAANFTFFGQSAHAAGDPYNGRSALDAVQLMNLGVEFLREHMVPQARVHYVITGGGGQPNVVPALAKVWYLVRAPRREEVDQLWQRVLKCASGAAEMTETRYDMEMIKAIWNVLPNQPMIELLDACFREIGPPKFGPAEQAFAQEITGTIPSEQRISSLREARVPEELWDRVLLDTILPIPTTEDPPRGSTDVGDVSWCCPTAQISAACLALGTPGHSWQYSAQSGMGIGQAGMLTAAKVLAEAGYALMTRPELLVRAKADFVRRTGGKPYRSVMAPGQQPAFHQFSGS